MKKIKAFSLIELIIFIVIMGIIATLLVSLYATTLKNSAVINNQNTASKIAARCMDWYLGERFINGFNSANLNCANPPTTPTFCAASAGYTITSLITCPTLYGEPGKYKIITLEVSGTTSATKSGNAILSSMIADY